MIRITARHFCAGVEPGQRAAPILHYMTYWSSKRIIDYCLTRGWKVEWVDA